MNNSTYFVVSLSVLLGASQAWAENVNICLPKKNGSVRIAKKCSKNETAQVMAVSPKGSLGPVGPVGPKGSLGPVGPVGPKGDAGPAGSGLSDPLVAAQNLASAVTVIQQGTDCYQYAGVGNSPCQPVSVSCPAGTVMLPGNLGAECASVSGGPLYGNNSYDVRKSSDETSASCLVSGYDYKTGQKATGYTSCDGYNWELERYGDCKPVAYQITMRCSSANPGDWKSIGKKLKLRGIN
jgi:hypothetical protein